MTRSVLLNIILILVAAIVGVLAYKLSPRLHQNAELTLALSTCDLGKQGCTAQLPDGGQLELSIEPRPIRPLQTLHLVAQITGSYADKIEIDFEGSTMKMGFNRPVLVGNDRQFSGQTILPVCITGPMEWVATVLITKGSRRVAIPFRFAVTAR